MALKLYNTKTKTEEIFKPLNENEVTLYTCGPTVYDFTHIGHVRKYVGDDILKRTLSLSYNVKHVMNITDVGHLSDDGDEGLDKIEKGAEKEGKTVWEIAEFYTKDFIDTMDKMNVLRPDKTVRATDSIPLNIALINTLQQGGFVYETASALYFDTSKDQKYGSLSGQSLKDKTTMREDVFIDSEKKHPSDFVLWFKRVGKFANHTMYWQSPWGDGFPGWHIECSSIAMNELGETIDIHTGGIDHIPVHHENEIAQSECATGKQFVRFWVHHEFLQVDGEKMSKSKENFYRLHDIEQKGFSPSDLRYLILQTHYRKPLNFTFDSLISAQNALKKLIRTVSYTERADNPNMDYMAQFKESLDEDLNTAKALSVLWEMIGDKNISDEVKLGTLYAMDNVLGLDIANLKDQSIPNEVPEEIATMVQTRFLARESKDWNTADKIRDELLELGYEIVDTETGQRLFLK